MFCRLIGGRDRGRIGGIARAVDEPDAAQFRHECAQNLDALCDDLRRSAGNARQVAARSRQVGDDAGRDRISDQGEDDRNLLRGGLRGERGRFVIREDQVHVRLDQRARLRRQLVALAFGEMQLEGHVATFGKSPGA